MNKPRLLLTLLVRDEIDIIKENLAFHRAAGVEHFIVTDNGSVDGTAEYLRDLSAKGEIVLIEKPDYTHSQGLWVTEMARRAATDFSVDWIIHGDADEFFWLPSGLHDLRNFFADLSDNCDVVRIRRINMLNDPHSNHGHYLLDNRLKDLQSKSVLGAKVCHRPNKLVTIAEGNHHALGFDQANVIETEDVVILHYPFRTYEQYEHKIVNGTEAVMNNPSLAPQIASHWRGSYEKYKRGELRAEFERQLVSFEQRSFRINDGQLAVDSNLADFISSRRIVMQADIHSPRKIEAGAFGFVDVGARGGAPDLPKAEFDIVRVLVEPEETEFQKLKVSSCDDIVIGIALGDVDGRISFHEARNPFCSSVLEPNPGVLSNYEIAPHFAVEKVVSVECSRFDTLYKSGSLPFPDCIKIDVQGFEYQVLSGFGDLLSATLAIKLEAHFYPLYKDQRLLHDLISYLSKYDFVLRKLSNARSPGLDGDRHFGGDLVEVDAFFTKSKRWLSQNGASRDKFAVASAILGLKLY